MLRVMKSIWMMLVLGSFLVSCSSDPVARPFVAQRASKKKPVLSKPKAIPAKPKDPPRKASAGKVTFAGLASSRLSQIRVIPENGSTLEIPGIRSYDQVDGFWFRGLPDEWFKIPDHSEAWVGMAPEKYDGSAHRGGLKIYYRSSPLVGLVGAIRGGVKHPAWVRDSGQTKSPVPSPFQNKS